MTALQKFNGGLTLTDTALAQHQHTLTVDVHQYAVAGNFGSKGHVQKLNDMAGGIHRIHLGTQQGTTVLLCHLHHLFKHFQITGDDQGRKLIAHQTVEHAGTLANVHAGQVLHLALSENLQALIVKIVIEAHKLQRRTKGIAHGNNSSVIICAFIEDLHVKGLDQFL